MLAGLETVPCLEAEVDGRASALLALVENLQRRDLHYLEEAEAIAAYRTEHGPFRTVDQLMEVSGIGEATLEALRPYITASAPA